MTNDKKVLTGILVLVFPILVLAGMAGKAAIHQGIGEQTWKIQIKGYDPRDLIYGHFLRFRYDWNIIPNPYTSSDHHNNDQTCLCVNRADNSYDNPTVYRTDCKTPKNRHCTSVMKVYPHGNNYSLNRDEASEKYFIPEENSAAIDRLLRRDEDTFSIELMAHKDKSVSVRKLYVNDVPLNEHLRNMPKNTDNQR